MHARYIVKDSFYKKAKKEGYRARSAYKLEEIQQRLAIIKKGDRVLDLGAAPGSWVQLESIFVGAGGLVVGLDILPITPVPASNVVLKKADIRGLDVQALLGEAQIPAFDVITSDIAPNLSGIREADIARIHELYEAVLRITDEGLRRGGNFLIKLFFSPDFADMAATLKPRFSKVVTLKPKASRSVSDEVYVAGMGKR
jgi:23S rRNA (uridine2552-2'-O)-methyltransferase